MARRLNPAGSDLYLVLTGVSANGRAVRLRRGDEDVAAFFLDRTQSKHTRQVLQIRFDALDAIVWMTQWLTPRGDVARRAVSARTADGLTFSQLPKRAQAAITEHLEPIFDWFQESAAALTDPRARYSAPGFPLDAYAALVAAAEQVA